MVSLAKRCAGLTTPAAPLRWLRGILLMAQPPLLCEEGNITQPYLTAREPFHPLWETIPPASAIRSVIHVFCSSADLLRSSKRKIGSCSSSSGDACCEKSGPVAGNSRRIPIRSGSATPRLENGTEILLL